MAALREEALLGLVRAAGGGVEAEVVAVLALLLELLDVAADNDDDVCIEEGRSASPPISYCRAQRLEIEGNR